MYNDYNKRKSKETYDIGFLYIYIYNLYFNYIKKN